MIFFHNTLQTDFASQLLLMQIHLKLACNWVSFQPIWYLCFLASPYHNEVNFEAPYVIFQFFLGLLGCKDASKSSLFWIFDKAKKVYNYVASGNQFDKKNIIPGWRQALIFQHWRNLSIVAHAHGYFENTAIRKFIYTLYCNI